jgi:hypothetical protein
MGIPSYVYIKCNTVGRSVHFGTGTTAIQQAVLLLITVFSNQR